MADPVRAIADAVLYEGYLLYPYHGAALKNRERLSLGALHPAGGEPRALRAEVLARAPATAGLEIALRFLNLAGEPREHEVALATTMAELLVGGLTEVGSVGPTSFRIEARAERRAEAIAIAVEVTNIGDDGVMGGAHLVLSLKEGAFSSMTDPEPGLRTAALECRQIGVWPVLVGRPSERRTVLASPIILPDFPQVAPESPGQSFDATEIDELLVLAVGALSDAEKDAVRAGDPRARALLERLEGLGEAERRALHGAVRSLRRTGGPREGDRVRLRPGKGRDALDLLLAGRLATVTGRETDWDGRDLVTVVVDGDPGQDLGRDGMPGHRFFFGLDEVEPVS